MVLRLPMTRTTQEIERDIADHRQRLAELQGELHRARQSEAMQTAATERKRQTMQRVFGWLQAGEWVAGCGGRMYWHREGQPLVRPATADDLEALDSLVDAGIVERGTALRRVSQ